MIDIVTDCSVVVPWFFPEKESNKALKVFEDFKKCKIRCHAPALLMAEFGNIAWKKVRRKLCTAHDAQIQIKLFQNMNITYCNISSILEQSFIIANHFSITVYDALYLVCAKTLNAPLATLDAALLSAAIQCGIPNALDY